METLNFVRILNNISFTLQTNHVTTGCWITSEFPVQRIVLEYLWLWITCFLNFILYIPMALVIYFDGMLVIHGWRIRLVRNIGQRSDKGAERKLAIKMLV